MWGAGGAAGLTLTEANTVFLMEPALNPGLEAQAAARIYRLGQYLFFKKKLLRVSGPLPLSGLFQERSPTLIVFCLKVPSQRQEP